LRTVANRLRATLRSTDTIARLGGDEFVVMAGESSPAYAAELAQKILNTVRAPVSLAGERITVSGSVGIAVYPNNGTDRHQLLRAADIAMYSAKEAGRNRYRFYSQEMADRSNERLTLEQGLRRAIEEDQLVVHYQPQVTLADGRVFGVEALVRWLHPELGIIPPARFIQVAEESGVIDNLGRWVLERACRDVAGMCDNHGQQLRLAVNVSAREFMRDDFIDAVQETLRRTSFPATALELEITESTLQVLERSVEILGKLHQLGIAVSIDDFGTGYSSLSVLRDLPIDRIKIDRSFILQLPEKTEGIAIVEAIIALASSLRMEIIAEGIERPEQAAILEQLGCSGGQGYLFSRPLAHEDLVRTLAANARTSLG
jgi:predicted signal transduction protein with EAL and GGDEF domain